jgi:hypothetical protein
LPDGSVDAVWPARKADMLAAAVHVFVAGS